MNISMPGYLAILSSMLACVLTLVSTSHAQTTGPAGEIATPSQAIQLSPLDIARLRGKGHKAALLWHTSSDFIQAVSAGAQDAFSRAGVAVIVQTNAEFDLAQQYNNLETALAARPHIILSLPIEPSARAFDHALADKVKLVFLSNVPDGYQHGRQYASMISDDLYQMGKQAADALAASLGGRGKVGFIFHDANYHVTNQRDQAFKRVIEQDYPEIQIIAEQGISDPGRAEELTHALLLREPELDGLYVTWAEPAEGVLAALRHAGNRHTKIVTLDLNEPLALDMAKGGNVVAMIADRAFEMGRAMAVAGMQSLLGQEPPPFIMAPALTITKENLREGWRDSLNRDLPRSIHEELE